MEIKELMNNAGLDFISWNAVIARKQLNDNPELQTVVIDTINKCSQIITDSGLNQNHTFMAMIYIIDQMIKDIYE